MSDNALEIDFDSIEEKELLKEILMREDVTKIMWAIYNRKRSSSRDISSTACSRDMVKAPVL